MQSLPMDRESLAVLAEYGYTPEEIATLKAKKVIGMDGDPDVFSRSWSSKFDGK